MPTARNLRRSSGTEDVGPIEYVGGKTFDVVGSTGTSTINIDDLTGGLDSAPAEDDVVVVAWGFSDGTNRDITCDGYTEVADLYSNDTRDGQMGMFLKAMTSSPDTSIDIGTSGGTGNRKSGIVQVFRRVDLTNIQDVAATTATGGNRIQPDPPSITPTTAGAFIVAAGVGAHPSGSQTFTSSDLTDFLTATGNGSSLDATAGMGYHAWTSGAFNPAEFGFSSFDDVGSSWVACCLALRPKYPS